MEQMKQKDLTKKVLTEVAKDLSSIFEDSIKVNTKSTVATITKDLIDAGNELQKEDEISDKSKEVLVLLGVKLPWVIEETIEEKEEQKTPVTIKKNPVTIKKNPVGVANPEIGKRNAFTETLIAKGEFTQREIVKKVLENFPSHRPGGIATMISDGKNPKYNKFSALVIMDGKKVLSFGK